MWVIISSDGDVDYTNVYGPFADKNEAEEILSLLPEDDGDLAYRTEPVQPTSNLDEFFV
jgi:hypothetical protein